jgi:hypothetical protein
MAPLTKPVYTFNAITIKISMAFFRVKEKLILKYIWKHQISQIAKAILGKKSNPGGIKVPNFKLYYRAIKIKTVWY